MDERFNNSNFGIAIGRFPDLKFEVSKIILPNISTGGADYSIPYANIPMLPDKILYGTLQISFLLNTNLTTWTSIFDWINSVRDGGAYLDYSKQNEMRSDITIIAYSNEMIPIIEFTCHDCFPLEISYPELDSTISQLSNTVSVNFELSHLTYTLK